MLSFPLAFLTHHTCSLSLLLCVELKGIVALWADLTAGFSAHTAHLCACGVQRAFVYKTQADGASKELIVFSISYLVNK